VAAVVAVGGRLLAALAVQVAVVQAVLLERVTLERQELLTLAVAAVEPTELPALAVPA
jgi:hypothetical protein